MLNLYSPELLKENDENEENKKETTTYIYIGGLLAVSFLFGYQTIIGSSIGSAGFLYYTNKTELTNKVYNKVKDTYNNVKEAVKETISKNSNKQDKKINELTSVFVDSKYSDDIV